MNTNQTNEGDCMEDDDCCENCGEPCDSLMQNPDGSLVCECCLQEHEEEEDVELW